MNTKVLIVEDEFIVSNDLRLILRQAGYTVTDMASSAEEAEESIQKQRPDIVLLDIRLEGKQSGIDLARKLKARNIPFVYLSANSNQKILEQAKATEPDGFLVKPFREKDLLVTLEVAQYRHLHSLESRLRQDELLQKQLADITQDPLDTQQKILKLVKTMQSSISIDFILVEVRSLNDQGFEGIAFLRKGFDDYKLIGEAELVRATELNKSDLISSMKSRSDKPAIIKYSDVISNDKTACVSRHKILFDAFNLKSCIFFPVVLSNGEEVNYHFCNRQPDIYSAQHLDLLIRLKANLVMVSEFMSADKKSIGSLQDRYPVPANHTEKVVYNVFDNIIGNHPMLLSALDQAVKAAPYNVSVLILGESGTGKEQVAQSIHLLSPRKDKPFVKINCAAIPPTLIESELFGHQKGAFTGAVGKRTGKFEQANGGTIFLDEIGELHIDMQVKLLRVLQEKEIEYVGGESPLKVDVRIVTATNRNLEKEVAEGKFRLDLYYRINVFPITLPPLRERQSDIKSLAIFFGQKFCKEYHKPFTGISDSAMEVMLAYHWPGNIRELENVLEQSVVLNEGTSPLELKRSLVATVRDHSKGLAIKNLDDVKQVQRETEREYIISILRKTKGRIRGASGAAELLSIKPTTLEAKMAKLNITRKDFANKTVST